MNFHEEAWPHQSRVSERRRSDVWPSVLGGLTADGASRRPHEHPDQSAERDRPLLPAEAPCGTSTPCRGQGNVDLPRRASKKVTLSSTSLYRDCVLPPQTYNDHHSVVAAHSFRQKRQRRLCPPVAGPFSTYASQPHRLTATQPPAHELPPAESDDFNPFPIQLASIPNALLTPQKFHAVLDSTTIAVMHRLGQWMAAPPAPLAVAAEADERASMSLEAIQHTFATLDRVVHRRVGSRAEILGMEGMWSRIFAVWRNKFRERVTPLTVRTSFIVEAMTDDSRLLDAHLVLSWALLNLSAPCGPTAPPSEVAVAMRGVYDAVTRPWNPASSAEQWLQRHIRQHRIEVEHALARESEHTLREQGISRSDLHGRLPLSSPELGIAMETQLEIVETLRRGVGVARLYLPCNMRVYWDRPRQSPKYGFTTPEWGELFGASRRLIKVLNLSSFPVIWADVREAPTYTAQYVQQLKRRQEWIPIKHRCLQAIYKATGEALDNTCDLKLTPDTWKMLRDSAACKVIPIPPGFGLSAERRGETDRGRNVVGLLSFPPKPTTPGPGITAADVRFMLDQLEWRVFEATFVLHTQYYPSGRMRAATLVVTGCTCTEEILASSEIAPTVYRSQPWVTPLVALGTSERTPPAGRVRVPETTT